MLAEALGLAGMLLVPVVGYFLARRRNRKIIAALEDGPDLEHLKHWN